MNNVAAPASRNARCACGSGRRYKECHGALAAGPDALAAARVHFEQGRVEEARDACEARLRTVPDDTAALELLARCATAQQRTLGALRLWLRTARTMASAPVTPSFAYGVWTALTSTFVDALRGLEAGPARQRREAYRAFVAARSGGERGGAIAVVLVVPAQASAGAVDATLRSIAAQTRMPAELIVAPLGPAQALDALRARHGLLPFPVRWVEVAPPDKAAALNAAVDASRSRWIVTVEPPHAFAPSHFAELAGAVEAGGAQWGFSGATIDAGGASTEAVGEARAALDAARTALAKAESIGLAFIDAFVAVGDGALLFSRELHRAVGGFRPVAGHESWDFALRATLHDEPAHVAAATYLHAAAPEHRGFTVAERDAALLAMFRAHYATALDENLAAGNPFAPSLRHWGLAFLRRMFGNGHVLMVDIDTLDRVARRIESQAAAESPPSLTPGVNLIGFPYAEFGLGENLRAMARGCQAAGIAFVVNDVEQRINARQADGRLADHVSADLRHRLSLLCVNPDVLDAARPWLERTRRAGGRSVGYWYWELETLPRAWASAIDAVDELWCATGFIAGALRRATSKPVVTIPPALEVSLSRPYRRAEFGLPPRPFLFLFTFDYDSFIARKNPEAVVTAFRRAFPAGRDDVGLVVKSVNGARRPERMARIERLIGGDPRIRHIDGFLDRDASWGLISVADCYVSLHRSEGLGLGLAEAMQLGKPTIATGYSGNLEFMNDANSLLVAHRLVAVAPGEYLFDDSRFFWAEPDVDDASRKMQRLVEDRALYARLADAGPAAVEVVFGRDRAVALLRARLAALGLDASPGFDGAPKP